MAALLSSPTRIRTFTTRPELRPRSMGGACHRSLAPLVTFVLAMLLVSTTPIGTGGGVHQFDLVHPLFSHLHLYAGRLLTHEQLEQAIADHMQASRPSVPGPAFGAGTAADALDGGLALGPLVPLQPVASVASRPGQRLDLDDVRVPRGRTEAPPDPPPLGRRA